MLTAFKCQFQTRRPHPQNAEHVAFEPASRAQLLAIMHSEHYTHLLTKQSSSGKGGQEVESPVPDA